MVEKKIATMMCDQCGGYNLTDGPSCAKCSHGPDVHEMERRRRQWRKKAPGETK